MKKKYLVSDGCGGVDELSYLINHYVTRSDQKSCRGCGTNLDYYSKVINCCEDVTWQMVKCLRCGDVSLIDL